MQFQSGTQNLAGILVPMSLRVDGGQRSIQLQVSGGFGQRGSEHDCGLVELAVLRIGQSQVEGQIFVRRCGIQQIDGRFILTIRDSRFGQPVKSDYRTGIDLQRGLPCFLSFAPLAQFVHHHAGEQPRLQLPRVQIDGSAKLVQRCARLAGRIQSQSGKIMQAC